MPTRQEMWDRLGGTADLLIIGGGINGAGIARDAARRGLKVALVEMSDLAYGTSSRSSKLVHGGLRYLELFEFSLVFESVSERRILLDIAPHMVNPLSFLFPVYKGSRHNIWIINAGMWLYEGLSLFRSPKRHKKLSKDEVARKEPSLRTHKLTGAPLYYDCSTDDARLTLESALDAAHVGAVISTYARCKSFLKDSTGRITGAVVENTRTGELKEIHAHAVVNATGPWTDRVISMSAPLASGSLLRPTKGVHIVVDHQRVPVNHAVVCFHPKDERVLFAIPWGDRTYIGTTDTDYEGDPSDVRANLSDVDYLINAANHYFPGQGLTYDDVIATWAGLRPLIQPVAEVKRSESAVSREHQIIVGQDGLITIAGGKLTTYRRMSAEVVDTVIKLLRLSNQLPEQITQAKTDSEPLPGAVGWPSDDDHERVASQVQDVGGSDIISIATARLLANTYGTRGIEVARLARKDSELAKPLVEGRPEIMAQVDYAVNEELACTLSDIMVRRTQLFYRDLDQGLGASEAVASRLATLLGWDDTERQRNIDEYAAEVGESRKWRVELAAQSPG